MANEDSFQRELAWCLAQLQISAGGSGKRAQENARVSRLLSSDRTPFPRKRQLMRAAFGDYRTKMRSHPLPDLSPPSLLTSVEAEGVFYRRARSQVEGEGASEGVQFKFKFQIAEDGAAELS